MPDSRHFAAAIFDLDGTIADSSPLHLQSFNAVLKRYGVQIPRETWFRLYEGTGSKHIFEDVFAKHGLAGKADIEALRAERLPIFRALATQQLLPVKGFARFYSELKELGVPLMIATNSEEQNVTLVLQLLKLDEEPLVSAVKLGKMKPDPAVYLLALQRLGVPAQRCLVFEDSVSGVVAAKRAGCYCIALLTTTTHEELVRAGADLIVQDFTKLTPGMFFALH